MMAGHFIAPFNDQAKKDSMSPSVEKVIRPRPPLLLETIDTLAVRGASPAKNAFESALCPIEAASDKGRAPSFLQPLCTPNSANWKVVCCARRLCSNFRSRWQPSCEHAAVHPACIRASFACVRPETNDSREHPQVTRSRSRDEHAFTCTGCDVAPSYVLLWASYQHRCA